MPATIPPNHQPAPQHRTEETPMDYTPAVTYTPAPRPELALCPACGYQTLALTGRGLACLDCAYTHPIPELAITPAAPTAADARAHYFPGCRCLACLH